MAWLRVEPKLPDHPKTVQAGHELGKYGVARALALWLAGGCYAVDHFTDGFIPRGFVAPWPHDPRPLTVAGALTKSGLWKRVKGGWIMHDFDDFNPSGADAKAERDRKRQLARDRKRRERERRMNIDDPSMSRGKAGVTVTLVTRDARDRHARVTRRKSVGHAKVLARACAPPISISISSTSDQEQRPPAASRTPDDNFALKELLAHQVFDEVDAGAVDRRDALEEIKCRIAKAGLPYGYGDAHRAAESAASQRRRRA